MKNDIYFAFLRHGRYQQQAQVPSAWQPHPLDQEGFTQSYLAADHLSEFVTQNNLEFYPEVFSSNLLRAWQTADVLRQQLCLTKVVSNAHLNERCVGALANLTVQQIDNILHQDPRVTHPGLNWKSDSYYRLPTDGAESLMESGERVAQFIRNQLALLTKQNQLPIFVGHGASFRHAAYKMGILNFDEISALSTYYAHPMIFHWNAKKETFKLVSGQWKVRPKKQQTSIPAQAATDMISTTSNQHSLID